MSKPDSSVATSDAATSDSVTKYLEGRLAEQNEQLRKMKQILLLYREHAHALMELTEEVFPSQTEPEKRDA